MNSPYTHTARDQQTAATTEQAVESWHDQQLAPIHMQRIEDRYERHLEEKARG